MSVVSDATAITTLLKAGQENLLKDSFASVLVPQAVWDELTVFHKELPEFIALRRISDSGIRLPGTELLGRGEAEALLLARELSAALLLTDDRKARLAAQRLHIPCLGLVGLIVNAKHRGLISSVRMMLEVVETKGGLYLSEAVTEEALRLADEV